MIDYEPKGCYKEASQRKKKIFPKTFGVAKNVDLFNPDVEQIFNECKEMAENKGYEIFAIQVNFEFVQIIFTTLANESMIKSFKRLQILEISPTRVVCSIVAFYSVQFLKKKPGKSWTDYHSKQDDLILRLKSNSDIQPILIYSFRRYND